MTLGRQIIDLVGLHFLHDADQVTGVGKVTVMQHELTALLMGALIQMIDAVGIKQRGTSFDTMYLVPFVQKKFSQIGAVLAGDAGDQSFFHVLYVVGVMCGKTRIEAAQSLMMIQFSDTEEKRSLSCSAAYGPCLTSIISEGSSITKP